MSKTNIIPEVILSLDWDFVTGDCNSYNKTNHCGFCASEKIGGRGTEDRLSSQWRNYMDRLLEIKMRRDVPVFVAECHASIMDLLPLCKGFPNVIDFDSHYDSYDSNPFIHCGNWIYHLKKLSGNYNCIESQPIRVGGFGAVFICKSSPWTPESMDSNFMYLIRNICKRTRTSPLFIGHRAKNIRKEYEKYLAK